MTCSINQLLVIKFKDGHIGDARVSLETNMGT